MHWSGKLPLYWPVAVTQLAGVALDTTVQAVWPDVIINIAQILQKKATGVFGLFSSFQYDVVI